jgi:AGZA family xanthine/uracil permease-like MFS transporter
MGSGIFGIKAHGSNVRREVIGGITTFLAMSYIVFVNPFILKDTGIPYEGVLEATCIAAAVATILMGLLANYPVALAPGMGQNVFFVTMCTAVAAGGLGLNWHEALAAVFLGGVIFVALSAFGFRSAVLNSVPKTLKCSIAAGIGLLIAFVGLKLGGVIVADPAPVNLVRLGQFGTASAIQMAATLTAIGLAITMILMAWRLRGAILLGILITAGIAIAWTHYAPEQGGKLLNINLPQEWTCVPGAGLQQVAGQFIYGFGDLFTKHSAMAIVSVLFVLFFMDLFDTVGTLVGVAQRANLLAPDGTLPRGERALLSDAVGTCVGAALGTSTVTSYIESATGVSDGARTGLANLVTGLLLLVPLFLRPAIQVIGGGIPMTPYNPILAPALIIVGAMMLSALREVDFQRPTELIPAFLTLIIIPFSGSIASGIAWGFIAYAVVKLLAGKPKECPLLVYLFAILWLANYTIIPMFGGVRVG